MNEVVRGPDGRWMSSGNPKGRPVGSAHALAEALRADLAAEWAKRGAAALADLSSADLVKYALASLPRELLLQGQQHPSPLQSVLEALAPDEAAKIAEALKLIGQCGPERALEVLKSEAAKVVEGHTENPPKISIDGH